MKNSVNTQPMSPQIEHWNVLAAHPASCAMFAKTLGRRGALDQQQFSTCSVSVSPTYTSEMVRLCEVLHHACRSIVLNYFDDPRIQQHYKLSDKLESLLHLVKGKSYRVGFFRPDILYAFDGQAKICEIGARYPLNGWLISYYMAKISDFSAMPHHPFELPDKLLKFDRWLDDMAAEFAPHGNVAILHDDETGTEILDAKFELEQRGVELISVRPQDLIVLDGEVCSGGVRFSQFILEMDREELTKIPPDVLENIINGDRYFNDIRTLILVHDKRILSVLYDAALMLDYLSPDDYAYLRAFLIPSYVIHDESQCKQMITGHNNLIMKLNSGGRGIGAYVKNACTPALWEDIVRSYWQDYMFQDFLEQRTFYDNSSAREIHLVGSLLCRNGQTYGAGLFRGSDELVVNVHQERALIYPVVQGREST